MYTGNNLDNYDKGKLILMLQVRQVRSLVTSQPYLPFCRHIIPILSMLYLLVLTLTKILTVHLKTNKLLPTLHTKHTSVFLKISPSSSWNSQDPSIGAQT